MPNARTLHAYLGLFTAPSILFFSLTGAAQIFDLHEAHGDYRPADVVAELGMVHKKQLFAMPRQRPSPPPAAAGSGVPVAAPPRAPDAGFASVALKFFFLFVSMSLAATSLLGIWIGLRHTRRMRLGWALLLAGLAVPVGLLVF